MVPSIFISLPNQITIVIISIVFELFLVPTAKKVLDRFEGWIVFKEIEKGEEILVHRAEFELIPLGPLRIPIGSKRPLKMLICFLLSVGVSAAVLSVDSGVESFTGILKIERTNGISTWKSTNDTLFRDGRIEAYPWVGFDLMTVCVKNVPVRCNDQDNRGTSICVESVYYQAVEVKESGNAAGSVPSGSTSVICVGKESNDTAQASMVNVNLIFKTSPRVVQEGEFLDLGDLKTVKARKINGTVEGTNMLGVQFRPVFACPCAKNENNFDDRYVLWDQHSLFYGRLVRNPEGSPTTDGDGLLRITPKLENGNKVQNYIDSALSIAAMATDKNMNIDDCSIFHIHYAAAERFSSRSLFEFDDSKLEKITEVKPQAYITIFFTAAILYGLRIFCFKGKRADIVDYNGLSRQYDDDIQRRGKCDSPEQPVRIGIRSIQRRSIGEPSREADTQLIQHIGSLSTGQGAEKRDSKLRYE